MRRARLVLVVALVAGGLVLAGSIAMAAETKLLSTKDAYFLEQRPTNNNGASNRMFVIPGAPVLERAVVEFDLDTFFETNPAVTIDSATLTMCLILVRPDPYRPSHDGPVG